MIISKYVRATQQWRKITNIHSRFQYKHKHILSDVRASVAWPSWARVWEDWGGVAGITPFWVYTLHRWDGEDGGLRRNTGIKLRISYGVWVCNNRTSKCNSCVVTCSLRFWSGWRCRGVVILVGVPFPQRYCSHSDSHGFKGDRHQRRLKSNTVHSQGQQQHL